MDMLRHNDERMEVKSAFAAVAIHGLQKESNVIVDYEQAASLPGLERYEISSGRRDESSRLQEQTSAAEKPRSLLRLYRHEWNSCPSR